MASARQARDPVWTASPSPTAFKAVTLEGLEVIFIVIAAGAGGMLLRRAWGRQSQGRWSSWSGSPFTGPSRACPRIH